MFDELDEPVTPWDISVRPTIGIERLLWWCRKIGICNAVQVVQGLSVHFLPIRYDLLPGCGTSKFLFSAHLLAIAAISVEDSIRRRDVIYGQEKLANVPPLIQYAA